jgi:ribonuclease BN (tRNA processing enzyme)
MMKRKSTTTLRGLWALLLLVISCQLAAADPGVQPVAQAAPTRIVILGTQGGPVPGAKRSQPANAVVVGDRVYLVDAGNGVVRQLVLAHLDYRRVDHIFITHNHDDHNADWGTLMGLQWSTGRGTPVHVYGPPGTESMLKGFLRYFEPNAQIRRAEVKRANAPDELFRAHDIADRVIFQDDRVKVTATEVCHYHFDPSSPPQGGPHKSFAFRFETPDKVVVFSGDTGKCASLVDFVRDADVLVHEVVSLPLIADSLRGLVASQRGQVPASVFQDLMRHMSEDHTVPEDIGRLAAAAHVKKVVLSHFVPGGDSDPDEAYTDGVKKYFSGPVVAARDLMEF